VHRRNSVRPVQIKWCILNLIMYFKWEYISWKCYTFHAPELWLYFINVIFDWNGDYQEFVKLHKHVLKLKIHQVNLRYWIHWTVLNLTKQSFVWTRILILLNICFIYNNRSKSVNSELTLLCYSAKSKYCTHINLASKFSFEIFQKWKMDSGEK
jgi:hypothetical protein